MRHVKRFIFLQNNKFYPQLMMKSKTISEEEEQLTKKEEIK